MPCTSSSGILFDVGKGQVSDEQVAVLRAALIDVAMAGDWHREAAAELVDVALRRWLSFQRRSKPNKRTPELHIQDLRRGLQEQYGSDIYLEPGWLAYVTKRFGECLLAATTESRQ